ncbi:hemoglobin [Fulvivirga imtechensis AK7]|uniref:Hemoglobin n=1 Tax=Fulvivirga imtechensis AK7 TaxID=1237149 RepID=L8JXQ4_9BACT|nr:group III truncated hemoglobin [Fulvivirga imtechensis]ELR72007.1 hemoglobin [Fulvivirga imtechensis AK7]
MNPNKEISSREEVKELVDSFYAKVNEDDLLSPVFNDFARVKWENHLPIMYDFWSSILLGDASYRGNPFIKHMVLPIDKDHFSRWLDLFLETVDERFTGAVAEEAKKRAGTIAGIFQYKMEMLNQQR